MPKTQLQNRSGATIDPGKIDEFARSLAGRLIRPADPADDAARRLGHAARDKHPGLLVRCRGAASEPSTLGSGSLFARLAGSSPLPWLQR